MNTRFIFANVFILLVPFLKLQTEYEKQKQYAYTNVIAIIIYACTNMNTTTHVIHRITRKHEHACVHPTNIDARTIPVFFVYMLM